MFAMNLESENRLRDLFHELKHGDGEAAPPFEQIWQNTQGALQRDRLRSKMRRVSAIAAAVVLLGVVGGVIFKSLGPATPSAIDVPWDSAVLISEWQAPTDFLLQTPEITFRNTKERN